LQDACDVIAWAVSQTWCSGTAGMMGISWGGFNSLQVAALRPPALKAIITICSTADRFADDIHFKGGCLLGENFGWAANMLSYSSRPPDPLLMGPGWREMWLNRLREMPFLAREWISRQARDDYWKHGSICEDYTAIEAAVLSIGGWHDGYRNTISNLVENLAAPVKGSSAHGSTNIRIMPAPSRASASCRRQNAGGTIGSRASTMVPRTCRPIGPG
jgi:predicted acyl esterase